MFYGNFSNKSDICKEFCIESFDGTVIFAAYETPDYEGNAEVIYTHNGKIFMVSGGHCSCYGLEGQWEPIEMPLDALRRILDKGEGMLSNYRDHINDVVERMEELKIFEAPPEVAEVILKLAFS